MPEENLLERPARPNTQSKIRPDSNESKIQGSASDSQTTRTDSSVRTNAQTKAVLLNPSLQLNQRQEMIRIISNRLFVALSALMAITIVGGYLAYLGHDLSAGATNWMVMLCGAIGGFISLQRRLKTLQEEDLLLLARSWVYVLLSPLVGGILALLLYVLFISGLLDGDLFPEFSTTGAAVNANDTGTIVADGSGDTTNTKTGLSVLFNVQGVSYTDYAKIIFWCFLAGYSESFVTNIISHFESNADRSAAK